MRDHVLPLSLFLCLLPLSGLLGCSPGSERSVSQVSLPPSPSPSHDSALVRLSHAVEPSGASPVSMSDRDVLERMAEGYRLQAELLAAEATGDTVRSAHLLDEAIAVVRPLQRQPGLSEQPRFRALFDALVSEYQSRYGTLPDSLELQGGQHFEARDHLFAVLENVDAPLRDEPIPADVQAMKTEVPLPMNNLVQGAIRFLLDEPEDHVYPWMRRAATYFPMIESVFAEEDVPDELKYLALVESGLRTRARSWASAAGPWQFMEATGEAYGLEVTPYVDERLDPEKSTRAAAQHLRDLYYLFDGDWLIALAGYNLSPTKVREAIAKARSRTGREPSFWDIYEYLPRETRNYVPTYIAAALVISNPAAFDLDHVLPGPRYRYDHVPVRGMLPLEEAARLAGTDVATLRRLNPELRKNTLPPQREPYYLRVPYGRFDRFVAGYEELSPDERGHVAYHHVRPGDRLDRLARRYELTVAEVMDANDMKDGGLHTGDTLQLPVVRDDTTAAASPSPEMAQAPRRVHYGRRALRPIAGVEPAGTNAGRSLVLYRVRSGDTLTEIAHRHDVTVNELRRWNGLRGATLRPGQQLKIYG